MITDLKTKALEALKGRWNDAVGITAIYFAIVMGANLISQNLNKNETPTSVILSFLIGLVAVPIVYGFYKCLMDFRVGKTDNSTLFKFYKDSNILGKSIGLNIITGLIVGFWTLLFIIPGIIASLSYSMAPYIFIENPEIGTMEALDESKRIMSGHKFDLFCLQLSFIGWMLLTILTLGLGLLWVIPYMELTTIEFYESIKTKKTIEEQL